MTTMAGDLSGGKILQRAARRAMDLKKDGLAFYEFEQIASAKVFKDEFRAAMDGLCLEPSDVDRLVHEANIAFLLNMRIFEVLDVKANFPGATVRSLKEVLAFQPSTAATNECPFAKTTKAIKKGRCPWPFIIFHDPLAALRDWQTWAILGVMFAIAWRCKNTSS
jgi:Heme oxygenase